MFEQLYNQAKKEIKNFGKNPIEDISLLKRNSAGDSYKKSQEVFRQKVRHLLTSESSQEEKETLPYLLWDMRHQVCLGDHNAIL